MLEAEGKYEAASHRPLEGGDWRERHPAQMVRPSPIVTFNHKWGHDALEETESAPARIPRFVVGVGGDGDCIRRCQRQDEEHKIDDVPVRWRWRQRGDTKPRPTSLLRAGTGAEGTQRR